jgi:hypothetical protein
MNILDTQDKLKNLSQEQLMTEMQMPTGQAPQFLVLGEITRRQKMRESFSLEQGKDETTVAQDAVAAAGMPGQFAGDMAGTMAPQTDTNGNTGAMPQQAMPPQGSPAPQTMSGGGIVALQEGGPVGGSDISSLMTDPTMMLMANRQGMSVQEYYDSLAPEAQGQHLARVGGTPADIPSLASVDPLPVDVGETFAPIEQGATEMSMPDPRDLVLGDTVGNAVSTMLDTGGTESVFDGRGLSPSDPNYTFFQDGGAGSDAYEMLARAGNAVAGAGRALPGQVLDGLGEYLNPGLRYLADTEIPRSGAGSTPAASPANTSTSPTISPMLDAAAQANAGTAPLVAAPASPPANIGPTIAASAQARAASAAPQGPPSQSQGSRAAPSGGGIASMAPQGGGVASDYEQELIKMLNAREKRAEQDKWMALAEAGMALMSSSQPTFGGALGEAGQAGLGALRAGTESAEGDRLGLLGAIEQSRMGREQMQLQRQAAAARAASGSGGGGDEGPPLFSSPGFNPDQNRYIDNLQNMIDADDLILQGIGAPSTEQQRSDAFDRRERNVKEYRGIMARASGRTGAPIAPEVDFDSRSQ